MQNVNAFAELITSGSDQAWKSKFGIVTIVISQNYFLTMGCIFLLGWRWWPFRLKS